MTIDYRHCPNCGSEDFMQTSAGEAAKERNSGAVFSVYPVFKCTDCANEWTETLVADASYNSIRRVRASVGGYFGGYYEVIVDLSDSTVVWSHSKEEKKETFHAAIHPETEKEFIEGLKAVDLLYWQAEYIEPLTLDGTAWNVDILLDGLEIKKTGKNIFPKGWKRFCKLISRTVGKEFA